MNKTKKAKALVADCKKNLAVNEYNTRMFKKVSNCSAADVSTIQAYVETIMRNGGYSGTLMQPRGNVAAVLINCGLYETS